MLQVIYLKDTLVFEIVWSIKLVNKLTKWHIIITNNIIYYQSFLSSEIIIDSQVGP